MSHLLKWTAIVEFGETSPSTLVAAAVLLAVASATATAQTVYRSVDSEGNVTYTDQPPAPNAGKVEEVDVQAGPSDEAQREARERAQRDQDKANQMRDAREDRDQQQQVAQPAAPTPPPPTPEDDEVHAYPDPDPLFPRDFLNPPGQRVKPPRPAQLPVRPLPR